MSNEQEDQELSTGYEFDLSKLQPSLHEWRQEGNQPVLKCELHHHTAPIPAGMQAKADERGNLILVRE